MFQQIKPDDYRADGSREWPMYLGAYYKYFLGVTNGVKKYFAFYINFKGDNIFGITLTFKYDLVI